MKLNQTQKAFKARIEKAFKGRSEAQLKAQLKRRLTTAKNRLAELENEKAETKEYISVLKMMIKA